jgi:hypothetical protein
MPFIPEDEIRRQFIREYQTMFTDWMRQNYHRCTECMYWFTDAKDLKDGLCADCFRRTAQGKLRLECSK